MFIVINEVVENNNYHINLKTTFYYIPCYMNSYN